MKTTPQQSFRWEAVGLVLITAIIWFRLQLMLLPLSESLVIWIVSIPMGTAPAELQSLVDAAHRGEWPQEFPVTFPFFYAVARMVIWMFNAVWAAWMVHQTMCVIQSAIDAIFPNRSR